MSTWQVNASKKKFDSIINLPASKSISNRALIIQALLMNFNNNFKVKIENLSNADDTLIMLDSISSENELIYVKNAGTCMRFLTAYFSCLPGVCKILDGDERMKNRPISALVHALRELGADIEYLENEGFPPLKIQGKKLNPAQNLVIDDTQSSQFLSAVLLVSPFLGNKSSFIWNPNSDSASYNKMTIDVLNSFGIKTELAENRIVVYPVSTNFTFNPNYTIESDWSSAAFFYEAMALQKNGKLFLNKLFSKSIQADSALIDLMEKFGVQTEFHKNGIEISFNPTLIEANSKFDCRQNPDLVPALVCVAACQNFSSEFIGLSKLNYKESKRLDELVIHLKKLNWKLFFDSESISLISNSGYQTEFIFNTAKDHRMVMAYGMLAFHFKNISLNEVHWVDKSFPNFWEEALNIGLTKHELV